MRDIKNAKKYINKLRTEYVESHILEQERDLLIGENNIEIRDIKGYHGREILELLQNADDAYQKSIDNGEKPKEELTVSITYQNNVLTVSNTGTYFDEAGIKAIVQGNNSPKSGKYIGNKGTGFRSILNWAKKVRIYSGFFAVEFSKEIAERIFSQIKDKPQIKKQLDKRPNLYLPMLAVPENINDNDQVYVTTIEIEIDPDKQNDDFSVSKQLDNLDLRILLFLPNISQIHIISDNKDITYKRQITGDSMKKFSLQKIESDNIEWEEVFFVFKKTINNALIEDEEAKDILLSIAVPENFNSFIRGNLYSFFPLLDTESPFNCVLHASYLLDDHRNTVNSGEANKTIINAQIEYLFEIANLFVENHKNDIALKILLPVNLQNNYWRFPSPFSKFELENYYLDELSKLKVFQTVNNENISFEEKPKLIKGDFPKEFVGENFAKLLKPQSEESMQLLELLSKKNHIQLEYTEKELLNIINNTTSIWNIRQRILVFIWWNKYWSNRSHNPNAQSLPRLLLTQNNEWLKFKEECFFLVGDFNAITIPEWVEIPSLHPDYQRELFTMTEETIEDKDSHISRIIVQRKIYQTVDFKHKDRNTIISAVNASVNTYQKAVDFVRWLWDNYKSESSTWEPPGRSDNSKFNYHYPCEKNFSITDSDKLFFGVQYNNPLAERLFDDSCGAFPPPNVFSVGDEDVIAFKEFVRKFGVKEFPIIETQKVVRPLESFKQKCKKNIEEFGDLGKSTNVGYSSFSLPYIQNLDILLETLPTAIIIEWIIKDSSLYSCLSNPYSQNAVIRYHGNRQWNDRTYSGKIDNYILEVFNESKWIEINDNRYSPRHVLQSFTSKNNQKFAELTPVLTMEIVGSLAKDICVDVGKISDILSKFNFCNKITDLDSDNFYRIMLELPNIDFKESVELSKSIYRIIEQPSFNKFFEDSVSKNIFMNEGKILVKHQGVLKYYPAQKSFLPSSKIIIKKEAPIVEKGQRTNNDNFKRLFGCQEYSNDYQILKDSITVSQADDSFQKYFSAFKQFAIAFAERNENIRLLGQRLSVRLVNSIRIKENGIEESIIDEYVSVRDTSTNWYITVFNIDFDINTVSEIIENIYSNIANTPGFDVGRIGEVFRTKERKDREFLIRKEFGSLQVLEDCTYSNDIKTNFINTIRTINETVEVEHYDIDFDDFSNIQNAPKIIALFKDVKIDVDSFIQFGFVYPIDLIPYYKGQLRELILREKRHFKDYLFSIAKSSKNLQSSFIEKVSDFERFEISDYRNSVDFDIKEIVVNHFGRWDNPTSIFSADEEYAKNYETMNPNNMFEEEISNDIEVQTMIYFNNTESFNTWLQMTQNNHESEKEQSSKGFYSRFEAIIPQKEEISFREKIDPIKSGITHSGLTCVVSTSKKEKRQKNQKIAGNKGELLIYNLLCEQYGKDKVFPRSEAFIELGIVKPGLATSGEYDLSYIDENGEEYFVEVKTGDGKSFIITLGEMHFAEQNPDKFKLFLVYNLDCEKPSYIELPVRFWEDNRFVKSEIIERIEFKF